MLDIKWIRDNPSLFDDLLSKRGINPLSKQIVDLDENKRHLTTLIQQLQSARNKKSKFIGDMKIKLGKDYDQAKKDVEDINQKLEELNHQLESNTELQDILDRLPNLTDPDVPYGTDDDMNVQVRSHLNPKQIPNAKQHFELGEALGMMDFKQTAKISGSRFVTITDGLARMERALVNFMLDLHTSEFEFQEVSAPSLVRPSAMYNVGQLPKFAEESFETTNNYRLVPTSEVTLVNMVADMILRREQLPMRFVSYSQCFRSEAGSSGRDVRGMIRMHQFSKVELVTITTPDESAMEHEYMLNSAEEVLKRLELPYRVMLLCTGSTSPASKKTYDIEVWLPGQNQYREISSVSNCGDYQARRMKARYKEFGSNETTFVHTLNGSGLPIGRTMIAIIENYQNSDGTISIPKALVSYMGGIDKIHPSKMIESV